MKNYTLNDYLPSDFDELFQLWELIGMSASERADNNEVIIEKCSPLRTSYLNERD